jgi:hypothetical protein
MKTIYLTILLLSIFTSSTYARKSSSKTVNAKASFARCGAWHDTLGRNGSVIGRWRDCGSYYQIQTYNHK